MTLTNDGTERKKESRLSFEPPAVSAPKGGGAIRGIGEKFSANPATGTGSITIPIPLSPGREGFGPQLTLKYDSGAGQSPFGLGWSLSLPSIVRKTDKGLPRYQDANESDVFLLSGEEDLVPIRSASGVRIEDKTTVPGFSIHRYRPRIEGLFARIERWTRIADGDVHWRSYSKDNILTLYGQDSNSRIADPENPLRIFQWLISETRDTKGNAIVYIYKAEDGVNVPFNHANEHGRGDTNDSRRAANRYIKKIRYGNLAPLLDSEGRRAHLLPSARRESAEWLFEAVFDYGEHDLLTPLPADTGAWRCRQDPYSSRRSGFEIRTYRLCRRVLQFHHFPDEADVGANCLVRSTDFEYRESYAVTQMTSVTQHGYRRGESGAYRKQSMPPLEFTYSEAEIGSDVQERGIGSDGLPSGVDGNVYRFLDLDGEGVPGVFTQQAGAWSYFRNQSPLTLSSDSPAARTQFARAETVSTLPAGVNVKEGWQFLDLAGDGNLDLVHYGLPQRGYYQRTPGGWNAFRSFSAQPNLEYEGPHIKYADLTGDGHADLLVMEGDGFTWYPSLGEKGFGPGCSMTSPHEEELGLHTGFKDRRQSVFLADITGDGLPDFVRIRNGEVCYWPNLGYGRFGSKIVMDDSPWFDSPDTFDPSRIRLTDADGTGTTDIIYLGSFGARIWLNQAGNGWGVPQEIAGFPPMEDYASVTAMDILGNGTAALVWSSSLPGTALMAIKYVSLMSKGKPHLLTRFQNNLGAETKVSYIPSTYFYLKDWQEGNPWDTKLPFPVHVVERIETCDHISRNRFVTRYAYHQGYYDGEEREFRGFGMVEQWDTEAFASITGDANLSTEYHLAAVSHVPPVYTKTWYYTGEEQAGSIGGALKLPQGLTTAESREALRACKGFLLREEVYADDDSDAAELPYAVTKHTAAVRCLQSKADQRHGVFLTYPAGSVTYHYERKLEDPRIAQTLTLEVDDFGNVLKEAAIAHGRRIADSSLREWDRQRQTQGLITYTEHVFTNSIDEDFADSGNYRVPLPSETQTFELTGYTPSGAGGLYLSPDFVNISGNEVALRFDGELSYEEAPSFGKQRRRIEQVRTLYRKNDATSLLELHRLESMAFSGTSFSLAFTNHMLEQTLMRNEQPLLINPVDMLEGKHGFQSGKALKLEGVFPAADSDEEWWLSTGRAYYSPDADATPAAELAYARGHFFRHCRYRDAFHTGDVPMETVIRYDPYALFPIESIDPLGNRTTVGERDEAGNRNPNLSGYDYTVLQAKLVMDANRNRTAAAFDTFGMVTGLAVMGKPGENAGDSLVGFEAIPEESTLLDHLCHPMAAPEALLGRATARFINDYSAFYRTKHSEDPQPSIVYKLTRETHDSDMAGDESILSQRWIHHLSYCDGFGREIQRKLQAEPDPVTGEKRFLCSGWTIFNNKGKPVRQFEPFFSITHAYEFSVLAGVSPILVYDPMDRVVGTLHPNRTYEKTVFSAWGNAAYDANDTAAAKGRETGDLRTDPDIGGYVRALFRYDDSQQEAWRTWYEQRADGSMGGREKTAALKTAAHANTPTLSYFDALGRQFLTKAHNGYLTDGTPVLYETRTELDIEGNVIAVRDSLEQSGDLLGRIAMRYRYDILGNRIYQSSMEAGERWTLADAAGNPLVTWDSRGCSVTIEYDALRRPLRVTAVGCDSKDTNRRVTTERYVYGEQHPESEIRNLRGKLYAHFDQAGLTENRRFDFKGNAAVQARRLLREYDRPFVDWSETNAVIPASGEVRLSDPSLEASLAQHLENDSYESGAAFDALNRPIEKTSPHSQAMMPSTMRIGYNESNLLNQVKVRLNGAEENGQPVWKTIVSHITYDAKGQRQRIEYGNGTITRYDYDPLTFRLVRLATTRNTGAFPGDCPEPPVEGWPGCGVQNLSYTYDPVGNIVYIRDEAQQTVFFRNRRVEPSCDYTYDPLYRLIEATGREHLGQGGAYIAHSHDDEGRIRIPWSANDGNAMSNYVEKYIYDAVGNLLQMKHLGAPAAPGWTRNYDYQESSLLEDGTEGEFLKTNNRLSRTTIERDGGSPVVEHYQSDEHGNITFMPHLGGGQSGPNMYWNYKDQLCRVDLGGGGTAYYMYDADGQRVRKVWVKSESAVEERIYFNGFEIFRKRNGAGDITLERETLHVTDGVQRIMLVETRTVDTAGNDPLPPQLIRYQYSNHLGSASLELDHQGHIISYEEYTPFGSSSYQAVRSQVETPKRYRYNGKERDEESGFYYNGARYYCCWLARWTSPDPAGFVDGVNLFVYVRNQPLRFSDPSGRSADPREAGKLWERQVMDKAKAALPLVEQVTVKAVINGKEVTSVLDGLGRDANGWIVLESKLNPTTKLRDGQKQIKELLEKGGNVTISASDKDKIAELRKVLKMGPGASVSTDRYKVVHQANVSKVLSEIDAIPKGNKTILHNSGELTVHTPEEMKKFEELRVKHPSMRSEELAAKAQKEVADDAAKKAATKAADTAVKAGEEVLEEGAEKLAKKGAKKLFSIAPLGGIGGELLLKDKDTSWGEAVLRGIGGEIGIGPLDLTTAYDIATSDIPLSREDDQYIYYPGERIDKKTGKFELRPGPKW